MFKFPLDSTNMRLDPTVDKEMTKRFDSASLAGWVPLRKTMRASTRSLLPTSYVLPVRIRERPNNTMPEETRVRSFRCRERSVCSFEKWLLALHTLLYYQIVGTV
jgi:hypothetical protein